MVWEAVEPKITGGYFEVGNGLLLAVEKHLEANGETVKYVKWYKDREEELTVLDIFKKGIARSWSGKMFGDDDYNAC